MDRDGTLTIRTRLQASDAKEWACLHVVDTGSGIPPDALKKIFDPFFTTKPVGKGTGLGLSISYGIVHKHKGDIAVDSQPGRGTTFRITLPQRQT